jgi:hypothetical protein
MLSYGYLQKLKLKLAGLSDSNAKYSSITRIRDCSLIVNHSSAVAVESAHQTDQSVDVPQQCPKKGSVGTPCCVLGCDCV